jgi:hypothetical protein
MPAPSPIKKKPVGLAAIRQSREDRAARRVRLSPGVGYVAAAMMIAAAVTYKCVGERSLNLDKEKILATQKEAAALVGPDWFPLRDAIESEVLEAAKTPWDADFVDPTLGGWDFRSMPGLYLRLRVVDARDVSGVRAAAAEANRDGFTGCLLRVSNDALLQGLPDASALPEQPWTMGQAYEATNVLTPEWAAEVRETPNKVGLDVMQAELDKATDEGLPLAGRMVKQARFFLLVLDEDVPEAAQISDGGITEATLQIVPHPARVYLLDLRARKERLRLRRTGAASFRGTGDFDAEKRDAMQRQVNNCALAQQVETALPGPPH